jgi:hypothetical protein
MAGNREVQDHRNLFPAIGAVKGVFHSEVRYRNPRSETIAHSLPGCLLWIPLLWVRRTARAAG